MCFSESASFAAAALLTGEAVATYGLIKKQKAYNYFWFVLIPLFFAIQQFSEGMVWRGFNEGGVPALLESSHWAYFFAYIFLFFAFLGWPVFIPLALYFPERDKIRKNILLFFISAGLLWACYILFFLKNSHLSVTTEGRGIIYQANYFKEETVDFLRIIYLSLLIIPIFVSSLRLIWLFGLFTLLSALIAYYFYVASFTSVWCFFAALLSLVLYFVIRSNISQDAK